MTTSAPRAPALARPRYALALRWLRRRLAPCRAWWLALGLLVGFAFVYVPFRSQFLVNWDAVNFALGVDAFNLSHHQPHPPGYVGYVGIGRLLAWFTGDANEALTLLSAVSGGTLVAVFYLLARRMLTDRFALLGAVLLGTSPLVWYYSSVALTYIVGAAVATAVAWTAQRAAAGPSAPHLYASVGLLALLGAVRQTDLVLLLPVVVLAAWTHPWRARLRAAGLLAGLTAAWLVPLVWSSGGVQRYVELSRQLATLAGSRTFVVGGTLSGILQNVGLVVLGLALGLGVALLALIPALRRGCWGLRRLGAANRRLLAAWVIPPLLVFLFVHTGQFGYVLLVLPPLVLVVAGIAQEVSERAGPDFAGVGRRSGVVVAGLGVVLLGVNVAASLGIPEAAVGLLREEGTEEAIEPLVPGGGGVVERTRQYVLAANDAHWQQVVRWLRRFPPGRTVVLAVPNNGGSFRHLSYYTPRFRVLGVGTDRDGTFGYLFAAHRGDSGYSVQGLEEARTVVPLPRRVRWVVVPDRAVQAQLPAGAADRLLRLSDGTQVLALRVPEASTLYFDGDDELRVRSTAAPASRSRTSGSAGHDGIRVDTAA